MNHPYENTFVPSVRSFENRCCVARVVSISSFPHAFSGNPGEFRTGPRSKHSGGDELRFRAQISSSVGERKLMNHFVVKNHSASYFSFISRYTSRARVKSATREIGTVCFALDTFKLSSMPACSAASDEM